MDTQRHDVVHQIIAIGYGRENITNQLLLVGLQNSLRAEMRVLRFCLLSCGRWRGNGVFFLAHLVRLGEKPRQPWWGSDQ